MKLFVKDVQVCLGGGCLFFVCLVLFLGFFFLLFWFWGVLCGSFFSLVLSCSCFFQP